MSLNENLRKARWQRNDEFYTQLPDIENDCATTVDTSAAEPLEEFQH